MSDLQTVSSYAALYADIMEEIKGRHSVVLGALDEKKLDSFPKFVRAETCYLQLRMICELIALGCLVAHGDIPATKRGKLKGAWNADLIVSALGKLHEDFYPRAGKQAVGADGRLEVIDQTDPHLTKSELQRLYAQAGRVLHRGNVENLRTRRIPGSTEIQEWANKITALLNHHQITIVDSDLEIWCIMHARSDGRVHTNVMRRIDLALQ